MSNRRLISSDLYEDEFIGSLDIFTRYLWVGLITACADDQGRILANPAVIRAKIFPFDDYSIQDIENALQVYSKAGKLLIYQVKGKRLGQILSWWKHQAPSWASPSKYPAPPNWVDRVKYHSVGNKVIVENWAETGGLPSNLPSALPSAINESEVKSEGEGEEEPSFSAPSPANSSPNHLPPALIPSGAEIPNILARSAGLSTLPGKETERLQQIQDLIDVHGADAVESAFAEAVQRWKSTRAKNGSYYRVTNLGWVDWAQESLDSAAVPRAGPANGRTEITRREFLAMTDEQRNAFVEIGGTVYD